MLDVRQTDEFSDWLNGLKDIQARARITMRVRRFTLGNLGDVKPVGQGIGGGVRMKKTARKFDAVEYLGSDEMIAAYLAAAFEEGDADLIRAALDDVVRARGVQDVSKATGLTRAALYKAVGANGNPTLSTLLAVTKALGVKLSVAA
jgi:probable addiction module antidote protein